MRLLAILVACLAAVPAMASHSVLKKRQATKTSVAERLWFKRYASPVQPRQAEASPSGSPDPVCHCSDGSVCPGNCPDSCPTPPSKRAADLVSGRATSKRFYPRQQTFIPLEHFDGTTLPPTHAADFFRSQGTQFSHPSNGSANMRDEEWIDFSQRTRRLAENAFSMHHIIKRVGSSGALVRFSSSFLVRFLAQAISRNELEGYPAPELVLRMSDNFGLKATDVIPTVRVLLSDPDLREITATYHVLTREMLENLLHTMCPRLGPQMCGEQD